MMKKVLFLLVVFNFQLSIFNLAHAGGMMSNTNQNAAFIRNPARDAAIGIDGVYSNPAGVALMPEGWHLSVNWQYAWQKRYIDTQNPVLANDSRNGGSDAKRYRGVATAPVIPSAQLAYNWNDFSFQFNFAIAGGGGKCEFQNGLGSFESAVGNVWAGKLRNIAGLVNNTFATYGISGEVPATTGYSCESYMQGRQYYFGFTLGTAYKIVDTKNLKVSGYAGARFLYGMASYKAEINNIKVMATDGTNYSLRGYANAISNTIESAGQRVVVEQALVNAYSGMTPAEAMAAASDPAQNQRLAVVQTVGQTLASQSAPLEKYYDGIALQSDQNGFGVCPILGLDVKYAWVNFAMKYEFRTKMNMKNNSTVEEASFLPAVNQFVNGTKVREDTPALLTLGLQIEPLECLRLSAGYHHFYDRNAKKTYYDADGVRHDDKNSMLSKGTDEWLAGVEYDFGKDKRWTVSGGIQTTTYGNTDEYMTDLSFVTNSWSFGTGVKYKINEKMAVNFGYFQTNYRDYEQAADYREKGTDSNSKFTRRNRVFAAGLDIDL